MSDTNGQKYTNQTDHSNRITLITTLLGNNVERSDIGQLGVHRNFQILDSYASSTHETQQRMPSIISKQKCSGIVQSKTPHGFQEPTSRPGEATVRANSSAVVQASSLQESLNASGIASLFLRYKV